MSGRYLSHRDLLKAKSRRKRRARASEGSSEMSESGFTIVTTPKEIATLVDEGDAPIAAFVFTRDKVILRTDQGSVEALRNMPSASKATVLAAMEALFQRLTEMIDAGERSNADGR